MQGLADGYFVLPYTIGDYLSDDIRTGPISTDSPEFEAAEKEVKDQLKGFINNNGKHSVDYYHKKLGKIMWDKCGMSRNEKGLKTAISDIKALREDFYKNVNVPGDLDEFNEQLAKAGRVADFLELGELFAKDALERTEPVGGILEKNPKPVRERQCEMTKTLPLFLHGNTKESLLMLSSIRRN